MSVFVCIYECVRVCVCVSVSVYECVCVCVCLEVLKYKRDKISNFVECLNTEYQCLLCLIFWVFLPLSLSLYDNT